LSEVVVDEKEKEREKENEKEREAQDKLGPLRPSLTPSKSAPVMAAVMHDAVEKPAAAESQSQVSASAMHKSASATPLLSLLVKSSPPSIRTGM